MSAALALLAPVLAALALVAALGRPRVDRAEGALVLATVVLAAAGVASLLAVGRSLAGAGARAGAPEAALAVASAAVSFALRRRAGPAPAPAPPPSPRLGSVATAALLVAAGAVLVAILDRARRMPDGDWDSIGIWLYRARLLLRAPGDLDAVFRDGSPDTHRDYPLLLPGLYAWIEGHAPGVSWAPAAAGLLFGLALVAGVAGGAGARRAAPAAAIAGLAVLALPRFVRMVPHGMADLPLAATFTAAVAWLAIAAEEAEPGRAREALRLAGLATGLGLWTKNEGCAHAVAIAITALRLPPPTTSRRAALGQLALGAAPFLAVFLAHRLLLAPTNDLVAAQGGATLPRLLDPVRWGTILAGLGARVVSTKLWAFVLPVALVAVAIPRRHPAGSGHRRVLLPAVLVLLAYLLVYAVTPRPLAWHLWSSFDRLLSHLVPAVLLAAVLRWGAPRAEAGAAPVPVPSRRAPPPRG